MINRFLKSDIALKLLSVIIAIGVWVYVVQFQNPEINKYISNIPIVFSQIDVLEQKGLCILGDKKQTEQVKIFGRRQNLSYINSSNITAMVDVSSYNTPGTYQAPISIMFPVDGIGVIEKNPNNYILEIDKIATKEFDIAIDVKGNPKDTYVAGEPVLSSNKVTIKGPKSIVDTVSIAKVSIDVSGKDKEVSTKEKVKLYDSNNKGITNSQLEMSVSEITIACPIIGTKAIKVTPTVSKHFNVPTGKILKVEVITPSEVLVYGEEVILNNLKAIRTEEIYPQFTDGQYQTDTNLIFDAGVNSADKIKTVKVKFVLTDRTEKVINIDNIKLENLPSGFKCKVLTNQINVTVSGDKETLNKLTKDDLNAAINLNGFGAGTHKIKVEFSNNIDVIGEYFVDAELSQ